MRLKEMFSPIGAPKDDQEDVDWVGDLKVFIDNDNELLSNHFFPAVKKHSRDIEDSDAYKIYLKPISMCLDKYCEEYQIENRDQRFPNDKLIELAKNIAGEQKAHIEKGDYTK
jgi:hypothetical protein